MTVERGSIFTEVYTYRPGYEFRYYRNERRDHIFSNTERVYRSTTAVAEWGEHRYSIVYTGGYGSEPINSGIAGLNADNEVERGPYNYNEEVILEGEIYKKSGYKLSSWSVVGRNESYRIGASVRGLTREDRVKLEGEYEGRTYEIRYVGGEGATGEISPTRFKYGESVKIADTTFGREGMTQVGWSYVNRLGKEQVIGVGRGVTIDTRELQIPVEGIGYVELEAIFRAGEAIITLDGNGGNYQ